jgi:hypothetical protein
MRTAAIPTPQAVSEADPFANLNEPSSKNNCNIDTQSYTSKIKPTLRELRRRRIRTSFREWCDGRFSGLQDITAEPLNFYVLTFAAILLGLGAGLFVLMFFGWSAAGDIRTTAVLIACLLVLSPVTVFIWYRIEAAQKEATVNARLDSQIRQLTTRLVMMVRQKASHKRPEAQHKRDEADEKIAEERRENRKQVEAVCEQCGRSYLTPGSETGGYQSCPNCRKPILFPSIKQAEYARRKSLVSRRKAIGVTVGLVLASCVLFSCCWLSPRTSPYDRGYGFGKNLRRQNLFMGDQEAIQEAIDRGSLREYYSRQQALEYSLGLLDGLRGRPSQTSHPAE